MFVKQIIQNLFNPSPNSSESKESKATQKPKILATDVFFGLVDTSDRISNPVAAGVCRNLSEFWLIESEMRGHPQYIGTSVDDVLDKAATSSCQYVVCASLGNFFSGQTEFFDEILNWIADNPDFFLVGHLLDRKTRWYELHDQCFVLNLRHYREMGKPSYGDGGRGLFKKPNVLRSDENFHDDYTPHWIAPDLNFTEFERVEPGHELIAAGLKAGHKMYAFNKALRDSKFYFYPTVDGEFGRKITWYEKEVSVAQRGFYAFNTENMKFVEDRSHYKPLKRLITLASGLMVFDILRTMDFQDGAEVFFYDASVPALELMRKIIHEWDGKDYPDFLSKNANAYLIYLNIANPEVKWKQFLERFGGEEKWLEFYGRVKSKCIFCFFETNVFDHDFKFKPFFTEPNHGEGDMLLWLSNVFHFRYTSGYRSLQDRIAAQDELLEKLKGYEPNLLVHMTSALGARDPHGRYIFRVKDYVPKSENVPVFWPSKTGRYPNGVRGFFIGEKSSRTALKKVPSEFQHIQFDNVEKLSDSEIIEFSKWIEMQSHIPWLRLDIEIPVGEMYKEALRLEAEFVRHRSDSSRGWSSLCLHGISAKHTEDYNQYGINKREDVEYKWTEIADRCPITVGWLREFWPMQSFDRVRYMLLRPGGYILPHNDMDGRRGLSATNLALNQPEGCEMVFQRYGLMPWAAGEVRRLDVGVNHSVFNGSREDRYHMIIHGRVGNRWRDWNKLIIRSYLKEIQSGRDWQ